MVSAAETTREAVLAVLRTVSDPELPAADVVGLGIVRDVTIEPEGVTVVLTPTFSGCPALRTIEEDVLTALRRAGFGGVRVRSRLAPAWSTDDIDETTRQKLAQSGVSPPPCRAEADAPASCPRCGATAQLRSPFGSTPCKALWTCPKCREPFEAMKAI